MEVWFDYGDTEIALDIKVENILENIGRKGLEKTSIEELNTIEGEYLNIFLLDESRGMKDIVSRIREILHGKGIKTEIVREFDGMSKKDALLIARAGFDPLFGYSGVASCIARYNHDLMLDILEESREPMPGKITNLSKAYEYISRFESKALEVIIDGSMLEIVVDEPIKASKRMIDRLESFKIRCDMCKAMIIGSGRADTLYESLFSLWNCIGILKEGGDAILLAEGSKGIGSKALDMHLNGIKIDGYVAGMECIKFIEWSKERYNISLVTSLPDYYMKRLGFTPFRSINHALMSILDKNQRQKVTIVQDSSNMILISE